MDSMNLLVTDAFPESAERINSLLRNSGILIHVISASKTPDIKRALDQDSPLLVIYANPDSNSGGIEEVSRLAAEYAVPFALYTNFENPANLLRAMQSTACIVVNSESESQLPDLVRQLVARHKLTRNQQQQRSQLEELNHRYELLLDSARDATAYIHEGLHVFANRAYLKALHVTDISDIAGLSLLELLRAEGVDLKKVFQGLSRGECPDDALEVKITRPDGTSFDARLSFSPARFNGEACTQMLVHERDAVSGLATELERMRLTDPLTQLRNKRSFIELLETELAKPRTLDSVSAVLYIEPDGLSELKTDLDLEGMDVVVADLALVLKSCLGPREEAARVSEYGIAVLTTQASMEKVEHLSARILDTYSEHLVEIGERSLSMSCSIGIATLGRLAATWSDVLAGARKAQAEAAEAGNGVVVYRPQLTAVSNFSNDRQWIDRIKLALRNQDFFTVQHSIINLEGEGEYLTENVIYLHDDSGDVAAPEFMAVADRNDLAGAIDRLVIPGLLKTFVETAEKQIISISNNSVLDYGFPGWLSEQMSAFCVEGRKVIVQISAAAVQSNLKPVQRLMHELQPLGCQLSISGFDAERRTRQLLEHVGATYVKIHPSLTQNLVGNSASHEVIRNIVDVAESRSVAVIADEVSDTSSLAILWQCGVKLIAGAFLKEKSQVVGQ